MSGRLFRRPAKPAPLLSDAEMAKLHEEIFEEPVSADILLNMMRAVAPNVRARCEWVMDSRMWNRIRQLAPRSSAIFAPSLLPRDQIETLFGIPIVVEPFAKLALRERES